MNVEIKGIEEIEMNIEKIAQKMEPDVVEGILLKQADRVRDVAISNAPQGETGNLKAGIISKVIERRGNKYAPAITAINFKRAPHAHLVEFGHIIKFSKRGRPHGVVPPHPFFRPAWDASKEFVRESIEQEIKASIEEAPG